jgi:hypothetical protein
VEKRCTFGDHGVLAVRILDILVGSGDALGAFPGAVGMVFVCPYGFLTKNYAACLKYSGHSMSSERMKKPDHLRFYSYLVDLKYHGR